MAQTKSKSTKRNHKKPDAWFIAVRGSYLPHTWQGWLTYLPFAAYLVFSVVIGVIDTSSIPVAVLFIVPNWVAAAVIMTWIAKTES